MSNNTFDTFGYNGVFQISELVANKLLAGSVYDPNLLEVNGNVSDGDFVKYLAGVSIPTGATTTHIYFLMGRPGILFVGDPGKNTVSLEMRFYDIALFTITDLRGLTTIKRAPAVFTSGLRLAVRINNIQLQSKNNNSLHADLSAVTAKNVVFFLFPFTPSPTGVAGAINLAAEVALDDKSLNALLMPFGITSNALRDTIVTFLSSAGGILPTDIPVQPGGAQSGLAAFDLSIFANGGDGGAELLLFGANGTGRGLASSALDSIPQAPGFPYNFAISLRADFVRAAADATMTLIYYYDQSKDILTDGPVSVLNDNTVGNSLGYMVVPTSGMQSFALPNGSDKVTISASSAGKVTVTLPAGALSPNARGHITNLDTGAVDSFQAETSGSVSFIINAAAGNRLALTIDAVTFKGNTDTVIWRPKISFHDGHIRADTHYYQYLPGPCDADGDAYVEFSLTPDFGSPFKVSANLTGENADLPAWGYALGAFGAALGFGGVFSLSLDFTVAPFFAAVIVPALLEKFGVLSGVLDKFAPQLTGAFGSATPSNLGLFLESVEIFQNGLRLSGYADVGQVRDVRNTGDNSSLFGYDRKLVSLSGGVISPVNISSGALTAARVSNDEITLQPAQVLSAPHALLGDTAESLWSAYLDDMPSDSSFTTDPLSLARGSTLALWMKVFEGVAKVLVEWPQDADTLQVSWIGYRSRTVQSIKIINNIKTKGGPGVGGTPGEAHMYLLSYSGSLDLLCHKFFLTDDTLAIDEKWTWDGVEVTDAVNFPGGSVALDTSPIPLPDGSQRSHRRLVIAIDQSSLVLTGDSFPGPIHTVTFRGTDVFGTTLETTLVVNLPAFGISYMPPSLIPDPLKQRIIPDPAPDLSRMISVIQQTLTHTALDSSAASMLTGLLNAALAQAGNPNYSNNALKPGESLQLASSRVKPLGR